MKTVTTFLKQPLALTALLISITGCESLEPASPYLAAQPFRQYSAKADTWLLQSQQSTSLLPFIYRPSKQRVGSNKNLRVQLIAAAHLARRAQDRTRVRSISRNQFNAILETWPGLVSRDDAEQLASLSLGAHALWLRALILRAETAEQFEVADIQAAQIRDRFDPATGFPENLNPDGTRSPFMQRYFTGQAALALFEHGNANSIETASLALQWLARNYPANNKDNFHPTLVPWHAFAIATQYQLTGASPHIATLFTMSDRLIKLQRDPEFPGRFFTEDQAAYGNPNTIRDALSTLTLMTSLKIAADLGDRKRQKRYQKAIWLALDNLRSLQYDHGVVSAFDDPQSAVGALRFNHNDELIRLDAVVFGAAAFDQAAQLIQDGLL